jgi:alkyl hydroperoxide reductase subunit AhpF
MISALRDTAALVRDALRDLPGQVTLVSYTSDIESWYSHAERLLLESIAAASPQITLSLRADRWDARREAEVGIARTPAIVLLGDRDYGIRYYGMPDGYELETFLGTIRAVAERRSGLARDSVARLGALRHPVQLEVFASPT